MTPRITGSLSRRVAEKIRSEKNPRRAAMLSQVYASQLFLSYDITPSRTKPGLFGWPCTPVCGLSLRRTHSRCFTCAGRRIYYGRLKQPISVTAHVVYEPRGLPFWRRIIAKKLRSLHSFVTGV